MSAFYGRLTLGSAVLAVASSLALSACGGASDQEVSDAKDAAAKQARMEERAKQQAAETKRLAAEVKRLNDSKSKSESPTQVVTVVERQEASKPVAASSSRWQASGWPGWMVQSGSFRSRNGAEHVASSLRAAGFTNVGVLNSSDHSNLRPGYWVPYVGPFSSAQAARDEVPSVERSGVSGAFARFVSGN